MSSAARLPITIGLLLTLLVALGSWEATGAAAGSAPGQDCGTAATSRTSPSPSPPVLAHFYIWFTPSSWNRAKTDYPAVGRYSSDEVSVMQEQVSEARTAGIDGFIVGWRSTPTLNSRLAALRTVAAGQDFSLAITYQAQDFNRTPLPVAQVRHDLQELATTYGDDPVFHLYGSRPLVALSGTWLYTADELRSIVEPVADRLQVVATEKNVAGYERVADVVQGDLYYWSSGDPERTHNYQQKLSDMSDAVHAHCGIWVAPVAPGFDARLIGGHSVIDRRDGDTLRSSWRAATASRPDAIGVISWNEFSENTYIEPSEKYGSRYLQVLAELTGGSAPPSEEVDSSGPPGPGSVGRTALAVTAVVATLLALGVVGHRRRRQGAAP
jgi:hypothetical protein